MSNNNNTLKNTGEKALMNSFKTIAKLELLSFATK